MISTIRRNLGTRFTQVLLWITLFSLAGITSITSLFKRFSGMSPKTVADIAGYEVSLLEYKRKVSEEERRLAYYKQQFGAYAPFLLQSMGMNINPHEAALQSLIQEKLIQAAADRSNITLSREFVMRKLEEPRFALQVFGDIVPAYVYDSLGGLDTQALTKFLQRQGISVGAFEDILESTLRRFVLLQLVSGSLYLPEAVLKEHYIKEKVERTFGIATFSFDDFLKKAEKETVSTEMLKNYFSDHSARTKRYWTAEKRAGIAFVFSPKNYGIKVGEDDIKRYYESHKKEFIAQDAQVVIRRIRFDDERAAQEMQRQLATYPARFAEHATLKAETVTKASTHDAAIKEAALSLMADGAISPVIKVDNHFEVIGRVSKKEATHKPLKEVSEDISEKVLQEKFAKQFALDAKRLESAPAEEITAFAAQKKAESKKLVPHEFDPQDYTTTLLFKAQPAKRVSGVNSKGYLVELKEVIPSALPAFESVESTVRKDYFHDRAQELMQETLMRCASMARKDGLAQTAKSMGARYTTQKIQGKSEELVEKLSKEGLPVHRMIDMTHQGGTIYDIHEKNGYVVSLIQLAPFTNESVHAQIADLRKELIPTEMQFMGQGFVASLQKNAKIEINNSLLSASMPRK